MKITKADYADMAKTAKAQLMGRVVQEVLSRPDMQIFKDQLVAEVRGRLVNELTLTKSDIK